MDIDTLRKRWETEFGGQEGRYNTFDEFLKVFDIGMSDIETKLVTPQKLTEDENRFLDVMDEANPVERVGERQN